MSIENHEYIDNKNNGINILAKEFGLGNDPKFGDFLNKKIDEILSNDAYKQRHQNCRDNRNSSDFYKYLVLHKRGLINNDLVKNSLERLVKKYRTKNFSEYDCSDICTLFNSYSYFKTKFKLFNINDKSLNKSDCEEFLNSSILNTILTYGGESGNSELYDIITSYDFISRQQFELYDLYKKSNKSRNKLQSWDDFFCNNGENISKEIKRIYDKYAHFDGKKYIENWKKNKIEKSLSFISANSEFKNFLTDIFYELNDNKYLEKDFIDKLLSGFQGPIKFLDCKKIENYFNNRENYIQSSRDEESAKKLRLGFDAYKEEIKKKIINFIPTFYNSYIKKEPLYAFTTYEPDNKDIIIPRLNFNGILEGNLKNSKESLGSSLQLNSDLTKIYSYQNSGSYIGLGFNNFNIEPRIPSNYSDPRNRPQTTNSDGTIQPSPSDPRNRPQITNSNGTIQPSPSDPRAEPQTTNSNGTIQPSPSDPRNRPQTYIEQNFGRKPNIKNTIEYIKKIDKGFKVAKKTIENKGIYISDEDIICVMLYNCSISKDETIDLDQKQEAQRILADNPNYSIRGKKIFENIVGKYLAFNSQIAILNSKGESKKLEQSENDLNRLDLFFLNIQKEMREMVDINDIKKYCNYIIPKIKDLEDYNNCNNLVSEKISNLIPLLLNLNKIDGHDDYNTRGLFMLYLMLTDYKNIGKINDNNIDRVIDIAFGEGNDTSGEFADLKSHRKNKMESYQEHILQRITKYDQDVLEYNNGVIARYEKARAEAENRKFYGADYINFSRTSDNPQDQTGVQLASRIDNLDKKLNNYKLKKPKNEMSEHEKSALMYTAFETTFNNTFNLNDVIVQKLVDLKIDLRSELTNYGIYNKEKNSFDENARNKFVKDRLLNTGFSIEEIETLGKTMKELPNEVEKNYEILCGNFDADQDGFEKISKIYALGEIIDNIRTLFSDLNSKKLGNFMNLQLDEESPADIIGDCLFIKGKINGTETNIKYDLRTGKVYMNSFTSQSFNPPKIIVGNTEPNTEIGDLGSFEDAISNLNSPFQIQNNEDNDMSDTGDNHLGDISEDDNTSKQDTEKLIKNKLNKDLKDIGRIVKEKAGEQGKENNVIDDLLKTFNILPDSGEPKGIEFMGGSNLFTLLESIKNTNNEDDLLEFSNQMKELMSLCELSRGKNNENPQKPEFTSITIFDIGEDNATTDIISLQKANKSFFLDKSGEKDKLKSSQSHFDSSIQLSFANIIVQKCCRNTGSGRKIATSEMKSFVKSIKDGIADIKSDKEKILAYETMFDEDVNLD